MITNIDPSQKILAIGVLTALKSSLEHHCMHVLGWLQALLVRQSGKCARMCVIDEKLLLEASSNIIGPRATFNFLFSQPV